MQLNRRLMSVTTASVASCVIVSVLVLSACSPAAATKPAGRQTPVQATKLAEPVRADVPAAEPVEPAKKVGSDASAMPRAPKVRRSPRPRTSPARPTSTSRDWRRSWPTGGVKDGREKIGKDANTLIVIALALGLHDQENKYKADAGAVIRPPAS